MRKLLNTVYITQDQAYLSLDGENLVCRMEDGEKFRIPLANVESVVCFSYLGCSPALMGKCVENKIPIVFLSPNGKFLAKVEGETKGNVSLRINQIDCFREHGLELSQNTIAAKLANSINLIKRSMHDIPELRADYEVLQTIEMLKDGISASYNAKGADELLGVEGNCARKYFSVFNRLFTVNGITFSERSKRPPLDMPNAVLSFVYTLYTNEFASALETVGLDSYIGFMHQLRSGRASLACDLVEEVRCIVERFMFTLFNLKILTQKDFDFQYSGAVWLNEDGRKKVLTKWQEKKRTEIVHPYLEQKIQFGLLPYVQSNLLSKYVRGEIDEYPCFINR